MDGGTGAEEEKEKEHRSFKVRCRDKDPKAIRDTLSRNLDTCNDWLVDNRLSLHLGKTEAMICSTKQKAKNTEGFKVRCRDITIKTTTRVKYLGVNLDNTLSGEGILDNIVKKEKEI